MKNESVLPNEPEIIREARMLRGAIEEISRIPNSDPRSPISVGSPLAACRPGFASSRERDINNLSRSRGSELRFFRNSGLGCGAPTSGGPTTCLEAAVRNYDPPVIQDRVAARRKGLRFSSFATASFYALRASQDKMADRSSYDPQERRPCNPRESKIELLSTKF